MYNPFLGANHDRRECKAYFRKVLWFVSKTRTVLSTNQMQNLDQSVDRFSPRMSVSMRLPRVLIGGNPCAHIRQLQADTQSIYFSPHLGSIWSLCVSLYYWSPVVKADGSSVNFTQVPFKPQWRWPTLIWTFNQADDQRAFGLSSKCSFLD